MTWYGGCGPRSISGARWPTWKRSEGLESRALDWHIWLAVLGLAGELLPEGGRPARLAGLLRRPVCDRGAEQLLLPPPGEGQLRALAGPDHRRFRRRGQDEPLPDAPPAPARSRGTDQSLHGARGRAGRKAGPHPDPAPTSDARRRTALERRPRPLPQTRAGGGRVSRRQLVRGWGARRPRAPRSRSLPGRLAASQDPRLANDRLGLHTLPRGASFPPPLLRRA